MTAPFISFDHAPTSLTVSKWASTLAATNPHSKRNPPTLPPLPPPPPPPLLPPPPPPTEFSKPSFLTKLNQTYGVLRKLTKPKFWTVLGGLVSVILISISEGWFLGCGLYKERGILGLLGKLFILSFFSILLLLFHFILFYHLISFFFP